jgi:hypothetical protein
LGAEEKYPIVGQVVMQKLPVRFVIRKPEGQVLQKEAYGPVQVAQEAWQPMQELLPRKGNLSLPQSEEHTDPRRK